MDFKSSDLSSVKLNCPLRHSFADLSSNFFP